MFINPLLMTPETTFLRRYIKALRDISNKDKKKLKYLLDDDNIYEEINSSEGQKYLKTKPRNY